jgi:Eukaryotic aspartyl protease
MTLAFILTGTMQGLWNTKLDGITINGNDTQVSTKDAIINSGTSLIIGDHDSIANIYAGIPGSSQVNETAVLPSDARFQYWTCTFVTELTVQWLTDSLENSPVQHDSECIHSHRWHSLQYFLGPFQTCRRKHH